MSYDRNGARNGDRDGVKVVSILGNEYSIKAPMGEEQTLLDAAAMLKSALAATKRKYPSLIGDRLLVLAALNLCSQQIELKQQHETELSRYQEQVSATVEVISRTLARG
jgi:cell division protein ZapA (FtsZ GTPase activity inhibitor)